MTFKFTSQGSGALGESIFAKHMTDAGYLVYRLINGFTCPRCDFHGWGEGRYHPFDFLCCKPFKPQNFDFSDCFYAEVKTKTGTHPLNEKFNEIGFNLADWEDYKRIATQTSIPFWIVFVDRDQIYGSTVDMLNQKLVIDGREYPRRWNWGETNSLDQQVVDKWGVFFSKTVMKPMGKLTQDEINKLQNVARKQSTITLPRTHSRA